MTASPPDPGVRPEAAAGRRAGWRRLLDDLTEVRSAPHAHRVAVRAATSLLVPLLALWGLGRLDLSVYATFGAFASVYGGGVVTASRWRTQARLGAILAAASVSGALVGLSPVRGWLAIPVAAGWASLAAALSDRQRWRPPGPMFPVFAVATCAAIPGTPALVLQGAVVVTATAAFAVGLGAAEVWLRDRAGRPPDPPAPSGPPMPRAERQRIQLIRCGVVVAVAGLLATLAGIGHPYWAVVASVAPLTVFTFRGQLVRGVHRAVGTLLGVAVSAGLLLAPLPVPAMLLVAAGLFACAELLVVRHYGAALVVITPLALLSMQVAHPEPVGVLVMDRLIETLIGVAVGLLAAVITRDRAAPG